MLASEGRIALPLVLVVVAGRALLGDVLRYLAARRFGRPVRAWMLRHGVPFVIAVRFLPSGRIAGALGATYSVGLGSAAAANPFYAAAIGIGVASPSSWPPPAPRPSGSSTAARCAPGPRPGTPANLPARTARRAVTRRHPSPRGDCQWASVTLGA
ncbi:hypothetical protein ABTY53_17355 [Streptomyces noursei]|uniref:hypothetical protein n=1 Tax=Streptomyces noursei TaxID=1971 RepID=UPI003324226D